MAHLCPTNSVGGESIYHIDTISSELEQIVFRVSNHIPVCIVSGKDFEFYIIELDCLDYILCSWVRNHRHYPYYNIVQNSNLDCVVYGRLIVGLSL
jgi:hypothetical protein